MDVSLGTLIDFYQFTTGRSLFALDQVLAAAKDREKLDDVVEHVKVAIAHAKTVRSLESEYAVAQSAPKGNAKLVAIDVKVDRAVVALRDAMQAHVNASDDDDPAGDVARNVLADLFPKGVQAITQLPFVDQLSAVERVLAALDSRHADAVETLQLGRFVKRLATVTDLYRAAMQTTPPGAPDKGKVRAALARNQELLLEVTVMIAGRFPTASAEDVAARQALLGPILRQQEAIGLYIRSRRAVEDVNPDTGNVEPAGGGAPPGPKTP